jgi:hypothetical protein
MVRAQLVTGSTKSLQLLQIYGFNMVQVLVTLIAKNKKASHNIRFFCYNNVKQDVILITGYTVSFIILVTEAVVVLGVSKEVRITPTELRNNNLSTKSTL